MLFTIPEGKHTAKPFRFGIWFRKKTFTWKVWFDTSCTYDLNGVDQADTNKLCGVGYFSKLRIIPKKYFNKINFFAFEPMHWTDSARFGWRYDAQKNQIELMAYCYVNGNRVIKSICFCDTSEEYRISLTVSGGVYVFKCLDSSVDYIYGMSIVNARNFKNLKYRLGVYFGGNQTAPHTMCINLSAL
jgi:hypothetical protein